MSEGEMQNATMACYRLVREPLWACIRHCTLEEEDNWWFLPDIQRSFVWSARSSLKLLDSILRGWPFGVLTVQSATADECPTVPYRAFLRETVNKNEASSSFRVSFRQDADLSLNHFSLVLDGQQRLQSLLFAFAEGNTGYIQNEEEWMKDLWGWRPVRKIRNYNFQLCPLASIYIDLAKLAEAFDVAGRFEDIPYADKGVICYAIPKQDFSSRYYDRDPKWVFPVRKKDGHCLKLSKLWGFLRDVFEGKDVSPCTGDIVALLRQRASDPIWNLDEALIEEHGEQIAEFVRYLHERVYLMEVGRLELHRPKDVAEELFQRDVVEIFTRLNHEGQPLTIAEITGAWVKNYWNSTKARQGAEEAIANLKDKCEEKGFEFPDFMRYASALWALCDDKCDKRKVVQNKDLSDAELLKSLAEWMSEKWLEISTATLQVLDGFSGKTWFFHAMGGLTYPLAVLVAARMKFNRAFERLNEQAKAQYVHDFLNPLRALTLRFMACSSWSGYWTIDTIGQLGRKWKSGWDVSCETPLASIQSVLEEKLAPAALRIFKDTKTSNRGRVRLYFPYLAIWHRLDKKRLTTWSGNLESDDLHVDHCVSFARWQEIRNSIPLEQNTACDEMINSIGNCMLLNSSTNIGRGKRAFRDFFAWLWPKDETLESLQNRQSLGITDAIANPTPQDVDRIREDILQREIGIRSEIEKYILGELDIQS